MTGLLQAGMDAVRINCAHDSEEVWEQMIRNVRSAARALGKQCLVLMDLPGPKLRTGNLLPGPRVLRWKPRKSVMGSIEAPARILITAKSECSVPSSLDGVLPVQKEFVERLTPGCVVRFRDLRGKKRKLQIVERTEHGFIALSFQRTFAFTGMELRLTQEGKDEETDSPVTGNAGILPSVTEPVIVYCGEKILLVGNQEPSRPARRNLDGSLQDIPVIRCTLPDALEMLKIGERVIFDDGRVCATVESRDARGVRLQVRSTPSTPGKIGEDKGINLPDSDVSIRGLTEEDLSHLDFIARYADAVGLSFVRTSEDVLQLRAELEKREASWLSIIIKIETTQAFAHLPQILFTALQSHSAGIMIARGDLALECGYERMAEVHEEILWLAEAAHLPVIWATQVLENLAKTGIPSRAEVSDAALGERADCVMLNKGPHIVEAVQTLGNILSRMGSHQDKKTAMLRKLSICNPAQFDGSTS